MLVACASFKLIIAFEFTMLPPPPSFCSSQVIGLERGGERYPIMIMISIAYDISSHVLIIKSLYPTYHIPQLPLSPPSPPSTLHPPLPVLAFMHYHSNSNSQFFFFPYMECWSNNLPNCFSYYFWLRNLYQPLSCDNHIIFHIFRHFMFHKSCLKWSFLEVKIGKNWIID